MTLGSLESPRLKLITVVKTFRRLEVGKPCGTTSTYVAEQD